MVCFTIDIIHFYHSQGKSQNKQTVHAEKFSNKLGIAMNCRPVTSNESDEDSQV